MRLLSIILPLAYNNGLPYVREQGLDILIDSGAGRSYLAQAVLDQDGPLAARARAVGAEHSCEAAGLAFPGASGGILGFDALGAGLSFELTLNELRLDETALPASAVVLTAKALGTATAPYPVTTCEFYGALACEVDALIDTGSPATIVNEALATAAGLFAIEDAEDEQGTTTTGLGGAATSLRRCRAAGILVGGSVQRPSQTVLVGDLPQWAALGVASEPACVLGLDILGTAVRAARATAPRRRKTRGERTGGDGALSAPRDGEAWGLEIT